MVKLKTSILLLLFCFIIVWFYYPLFALGEHPHLTKNANEQYYTLNDFYSVKKFDTHIHINSYQDYFIQQAQQDNFCFLDIVDDRPFGLPMDEQQKIAIYELKHFPTTMVFATTFSVKKMGR